MLPQFGVGQYLRSPPDVSTALLREAVWCLFNCWLVSIFRRSLSWIFSWQAWQLWGRAEFGHLISMIPLLSWASMYGRKHSLCITQRHHSNDTNSVPLKIGSLQMVQLFCSSSSWARLTSFYFYCASNCWANLKSSSNYFSWSAFDWACAIICSSYSFFWSLNCVASS